MVNSAWGKKRVCSGCAVRFYDLRNPVPTCPKCGTIVDIHPIEKSRKRVASGTNGNDIENIENIDFELDEAVDPDVDQEVLDTDSFDTDLTGIAQEEVGDL